jgi:membrane protein YdbS with pleckstrin-like domain
MLALSLFALYRLNTGIPRAAVDARLMETFIAERRSTFRPVPRRDSSALEGTWATRSVFLGLLSGGVLPLILSFVRSRTDRFVVHEHQLSLHEGIAFRKKRFIWMFEVTEVTVYTDPIVVAAGSIALRIALGSGDKLRVRGFGTSERMTQLAEMIRNQSVHDRHDVKERMM